ncbi:class I SAM-dependent rRNA methyltransferase [uncultured Rikenella sp.]|uniref:class I SAM-dependent rRNA methyltransferase n=1 Tax=uncultured Rikenella sp. TaxID=368003 RepID=UPI00263557F5|nr:class I SAM-dependent rRNA methyltransferase [uncultured Rikenella sp.]
MIRLTLRRGKEESLLRRHPWIFSGAIYGTDGTPEEGDVVDVHTAEGRFIARGHCGIGSIAVRVLTFDENEPIDRTFWRRRIAEAYAVRQALGLTDSEDTTCYRLVHGEGDNLPGLVIDIYGTTAVMQAHSVGMYLVRNEIAEALKTVYGPEKLTAVYDKSEGTIPPKSGIETHDGYLWQSHPSNDSPIVKENGNRFRADWEEGQKTGFFIDQRENRALVARYARERRVLNTFCYTGGFSVYALQGGAVSVDSVDSSEKAVRLCSENIALANPTVPHREIVADALEFVREMPSEAYDLVILDPPAFAKHRKVLGNALQGYRRLNAAAIAKMPAGGILFTFSCSQAVSREQFRTAVFSAAATAGRRVRILHQLTQPADHPVNIYHPEGEYLKGLVLYIE